MDSFEQELKLGFLDEAASNLEQVEQFFLELEKNPEDENIINQIFRLAHNLKGSSRAVGFDDMGQFTHAFEEFMLKIKNHEIPVSAQVISIMLKAVDFIKEMVQTYRTDLNASINVSQAIQIFDLNQVSDQVLSNHVEAPSGDETVQMSSTEESSPLHNVVSLTIDHETNISNNTNQPVIAGPDQPSHAKQVGADTSLRVSLKKVETLIDYVGEMVILQAFLREQLQGLNNPQINRSLGQMSKVSKEIQNIAMSLRMVPIKPTLQKLVRTIRDVALLLNKPVDVVLEGEDAELDKTVLEKITDPLVHLVRNAVDHGIEDRETRLSRNKPEKGTITLRAYQKSGQFIIEVSDDGGGLNTEKILKKAIEKKLISPNVSLSESQIFDLIFLPGFSTKDQVSEVSGRGVGMDVVKSNVQALGGEIHVSSELGKGTTFSIVLPLTLAIIDAMICQYGNQKFAIPVTSVWETLKVDPGSISQTTDLGDVLRLRGENLPIWRFGDFWGIQSRHQKINDMIAIINRSGKQPFALLFDDILGQSQVVVKKLSPELANINGFAGVTILGDGKPAFIVEPMDVIKRRVTKSKPLIQEAV